MSGTAPAEHHCRCALISRVAEARRDAEFTCDADPNQGHEALLAAADPPVGWLDKAEARAFQFTLTDKATAWLWCSSTWAGAVAELDMALDLSAAASPAHWLERMEDRLLDAAQADPGPYTAIACWRAVAKGEA